MRKKIHIAGESNHIELICIQFRASVKEKEKAGNKYERNTRKTPQIKRIVRKGKNKNCKLKWILCYKNKHLGEAGWCDGIHLWLYQDQMNEMTHK